MSKYCRIEKLIPSQGENSLNIFKIKVLMEAFVKHTILQILLDRGLQRFEEKVSSSGVSLICYAYLTPNMIKFGEHKLTIWK